MKLSAKAVRIAYAFAAESDVRFYLNGVHVAPHPKGGASITGCDGHRIIQVHDKEASDVVETIVRLDKDARAKLRRAAHIVTEFEPNRVALTDKDGLPIFLQASGYKIDAKYVDLTKILGERTDWELGLRGAFNISYIADTAITLADVLETGRWGKYAGVSFYACVKPGIDYQKFMFIAEGELPAWGVVMGVRSDYTDPLNVAFGKAA